VAETSEKVMQEIREKKQTYQTTFESAEGKKVLEDLERFFVYRTTFSQNQQQLAFNEGQRSVVLHIKNIMKLDLEKTEEQVKKQMTTEKENDNV
jgi:hypothetical protein